MSDEDGTPAGRGVQVGRDELVAPNANAAARDSQRRLADAEIVAGLGSWEWDLATDTVTWSPGLYRLHGMEIGDGVESFGAWLATVHPEDRQQARQLAETAVAAGTGVDFIYRGLHRDDRALIIHSRGQLICDADGRPVRMVGTLLDVSERHAAEAALRASEARARWIIDTASDAYVEHDDQGRVTEWNRQAELTFGWRRKEALGQHLASLIVPGDRDERLANGLAHYVATGQDPFAGQRREGTACDRDGREFPVEFSAWLIDAVDPPVFASFVRDISDRKAAQDELIRQAATDALTGLANRALLVDRLERALAVSDRTGEAVSLLLIDLDGFKCVNDTRGHAAGDEVLAEIARRWGEGVRPGDTLARLGGDEFALVLPGTPTGEAVRVARRLIERAAVPIRVGEACQGDEAVVGASVGIAVSISPPHGVGELRREADHALYTAKRNGRGQCAVFSATTSAADAGQLTTHVGDARAWARYLRALRADVAERKDAGTLPDTSRAPDSVRRTLQSLLAAIDDLPDHRETTQLDLPERTALEEFAFHHAMVQEWADRFVRQGILTARRSLGASRFWRQLLREVGIAV